MLKIAWDEIYVHPLPPQHRFPMEKYRLLPEQLLYEGTARPENFFAPAALAEADILAVHHPDYWHKLQTLRLSQAEIRATGFPLSAGLVQREITIGQGTLQCARFALEFGIAMNMAGGTHHAFTNRGEGFCLLNDQAMAARYLVQQGLARQVLIVDLDVHQGNGTAEIFRHDPQVYTFSMHGEKNYPLRKEKSDLDLGLPDGAEDAFYLQALKNTLPHLLDTVQPDFVFYQAGVDILKTDKLGRLGVSLQGCRARDRFVLSLCQQNRLPLVVCMGGGYSPRLADIVAAHANTFRLAQELFF
ncbi:MAG: histone deacetylase [Microscillaceae bacterium]|nr:histone deacetylase [Microscillaceae bacterium]